MTDRIQFRLASQESDLFKILQLQQCNLPAQLSSEVIADQGFVTVEHSLEMLQRMHRAAPSILAYDGTALAGYALAMTRDFGQDIPVLVPMFELLDNLMWDGRRLGDLRYIVVGQVCVAAPYRGQGVFDGLYRVYSRYYRDQYEVLVTEIATRNTRSLAAHKRIGFEIIHHFQAPDGENWEIVLWDWAG